MHSLPASDATDRRRQRRDDTGAAPQAEAMSAPSKEEIAMQVRLSRNQVAFGADFLGYRVIVALADENERMRAERAECLALLERHHPAHPGDREDLHRETVALVAKLRGQP
jgi:hypothetical protein